MFTTTYLMVPIDYLMVKIDAFVEVSARRLRNLQPISPHGS